MSVINNNLLLTAAAAGGYQVSRSLRFNSADSAYLSRVIGSAGNRQKWTWSGWVKRCSFGGYQAIFTADAGGGVANGIWWDNNDGIYFYFGGSVVSSAVFRDPSAWYHVVCALDTTQATDSNRLKLWINGQQITQWSSATWPSLNANYAINNTVEHDIGRKFTGENQGHFYLADIWFLDGIAATPSDFAETDATTGQWIPKAYTGSKGTNGFHLEFADNSAATAAALGKDTSGNGNNWTPNNFVAAPTTIYSNYVTNQYSLYNYNGSTNLDPTAAKYLFDGNTSPLVIDWDGVYNATANPPYRLEFIPPAPISFTSQVRVYTAAAPQSPYNNRITVDLGSGYGSPIPVIQNNWVTVATGAGQLYKLKATGDQNGTNMSAIEIDGVILTQRTGADVDSLVDTPVSYGTDDSLGGSVRGNYATLNPLNKNTNAASPTNGNLDYPYSSGAAAWLSIAATIGVTSGKYYWEITPTAVAGNGVIVGIANQNYNFAVAGSSTVYLGHTSNSWGYYSSDGKVYTNSAGTSYGNSFTANDVIGVALDMDNGKCWFSKNGTWQNSGSPTGGTNAAVTGLTGSTIFPAVSLGDASPNTALTANFGQRAFAYTAPSGFKALCDTNMTQPTIVKPATVMDVKLYTGNGSTQTVSGLGFSPDLVWIKSRNDAYYHYIQDTIRGSTKTIFSNTTGAETTNPTGLTAFTNSGFTVGSGQEYMAGNINNVTYAAWCWDAGSSTVTNTQGSITSQVRANTSAGFSVLTATTPTSGSSFSVGHGLGVAPAFAIFKDRGYANSWGIYHKSITTTTGGELLFTTAAAQNYGWFPSAPTSTTFTLSVGGWGTGASIVGYLWTPVTNYSAFGSFTGSSDLPFIYTGFKPRWLLLKNAGSSGDDWALLDSARNTYNELNSKLWPNTSAAEATLSGNNSVDFLANGFKMRSTNNATNSVGNTMIYACFAESPFQYARAR